jgi:SAM-dependent methyltransferase
VSFKDHFSGHAANYARFRPKYPAALFEYLASVAPSRELAWDCATGNGQAAVGLAEWFDHVIATDASEAQLSNAQAHPRVEYRHAPAEASGIADHSVDLVTVAQALHWLNIDRFYEEARRVLKPSGIVAVWSYELFKIDPAMDPITARFYNETVGPFWPPERKLVEEGYSTIGFPFEGLDHPPFRMSRELSFPDLLGYILTWSATQRFIKEHGVDPVDELSSQLAPLWGDPETKREAVWPLTVKVGRVSSVV